MDKNSVLAVILISLIMTVWLVWFSPQPPPQAPIDSTPAVIEDSAVVREQAPRETEIAAPDSLLSPATTGEERPIRVETDRYVALLSTRGGSIRSFQLKEYFQFDQRTPVEIVDPSSDGALSIEFTSTSSHLVSTKDLYFETDAPSDIDAGDAPVNVEFTAALGTGALRLIYTFNPDSYQVDLTVEKENPSSFISRSGYEIVWNGGVPFSEGGTTQEANVSAALAHSGGEVEQINLVSDPEESVILNGAVDWIAVRNGFFAAVLIPGFETNGAELEGQRLTDAAGAVLREDYSARLLATGVTAEPDAFRVYMGPIDYYEIRDYGLNLYDIVDYGFGQTLTRPIAKYLILPVFHVLSRFVESYGLIIIIFAIFIKLILHPLTKSSFKSMAKMRQLQPKMQEIKEKYGDDAQKQQQAMMKLYKESGVNPIGGCLPQLLQLPILYALFRFFPSAIEIRQEGFLWCTDLSAPDVLLQLPFSLPIYGSHVSGFPLLMSAAMVLQMRLQGTQQQTGQMKVMMTIMPIFILVIFNQFAAGLSLYYLMYNILSAIQQQFVNKQIEEEDAASESAEPKKAKGGSKPPPKPSGKSKKESSGRSKRVRSARQ
ncbi:MAG TPA: membrane protein insertase YidC [Rhodothermales bacterium]|nr:membrane protein insertase YidC [Rhodothermales bacterium]